MARLIASIAALLLLPLLAAAQQDVVAQQDAESASAGGEDLTMPPSLPELPGDARLEPPPREREDVLEAVIVRGQDEFRIPDLGTTLRDEEDDDPNARIKVNWLPLYDPENQDPTLAIFEQDTELRRIGWIKLFDLRFGGRDNRPD
ncbi:MAG: hypothetical protein R3305_02350 [Gammaproteobacteria bacterium]|nr:hypothetical protein [Gammaproteobacteria bacterium]